MVWTARQRATIAGVMGAILLYLAVRYAWNRGYVGDPQPAVGLRAGELLDRIDPNTADAAALAALPAIGPALAGRIIEEREAYRLAHPDQPAYAKLEDLKRVKGIGEATVRTLEPYLAFSSGTSGGP